MVNRKHRIVMALAIITVLIGLLFILKARKPRQPDVILITIDALRADHLGCYGYQRNTSPNIDRLAKEGAVFLNCFATSCGTVYSFPGILTGRHLEVGKDYVFYDNILGRQFTTLAEYLKSSGYITAAFVNNGHLKLGKGFEQGFDYYRYKWDKKDAANEMTTSALSLLDYYRGNKPIFIWIHYLDTHVPYSPPEEYLKIFERDNLYNKNDVIMKPIPDDIRNPYTSRGYIPRIAFLKDEYSLNYYIARYDAEIRYVDFHIGRLLKNTKKNTIIILTADHGEFLGEHNYYFVHEEAIYDKSLHVPLVIKDNINFKDGLKIKTPVSSVDIVPTLISKINPVWHFINQRRFDGRDLKMALKGRGIKRKYIYSYWPLAYSIRDARGNFKYILNKDGKEELYLLPDEYSNLISNARDGLTAIREKLSRDLMIWLKRRPLRADISQRKAPLDDDTKRLLKSLGYL